MTPRSGRRAFAGAARFGKVSIKQGGQGLGTPNYFVQIVPELVDGLRQIVCCRTTIVFGRRVPVAFVSTQDRGAHVCTSLSGAIKPAK